MVFVNLMVKKEKLEMQCYQANQSQFLRSAVCVAAMHSYIFWEVSGYAVGLTQKHKVALTTASSHVAILSLIHGHLCL